ncbi:MAG TPA: carboxypeptidase-like regulatory domain-containing protein [Armatimonadota bacterium]|jgi:hypothetical protein
MRITRAILTALTAVAALPFAARAQAAWADARFMSRVPLTLTNASGHAFAAGDVVAATVPMATLSNHIQPDGSDGVVFYSGAAIPSRALVMGGCVKVLIPLQAALANGSQQPGYTLYFNAIEAVSPPALPAGVQLWDFSDGQLHGWQSLQDPAGAPDVKPGVDGAYGSALVMDNSKYHHPIAFCSDMAALGAATVYAKLRTGGGENEASVFQRFNTQTLVDANSDSYLTGSNVAGAGLAVDSYGSQEMGITVKMGSPEGPEERIHPGPDALDPGLPYSASPDNFQYIVTATRDSGNVTTLLGDVWQAPAASPGGDLDRTVPGFKISRSTQGSESHQPLNSGKVGIMSYYSTLFLHWAAAVPNPWAEYVGATLGTVEQSPGPGPGKAIIQGTVFYGPDGPTRAMAKQAVTVANASGAVMASTVTDGTGFYRFIVDAGSAARAYRLDAGGPGILASASANVVENTTNAVDVPATFTGSATGQVTDAAGNPVAGAVVGRWLDGFPYTTTGTDGRYTLPVPFGTAVVAAAKDGALVSGPRWLSAPAGTASGDYTLLPAPDSLLRSEPAISPTALAGANPAAAADGNLTTYWQSGTPSGISPDAPMTLTWSLNSDTVSEIDVHWKHFPSAWRIEMTNSAGTRTYYSAGGDAPAESGGYRAPGSTDRHVVSVKTAPVYDVTSLSIVITGVADGQPISLYEAAARPPLPVTASDAADAMRIAAGLAPAPRDYNAFNRWNAWNEDAVIDFRDAVELVKDLGREVKPLKVLTINYQPIIESQGNKLVRQVFGWSNPYSNTEAHRKDMELASHNYLRIYLLPQIDVDEWPLFQDGTRYDDASYLTDTYAHSWNRGGCDYNAILKEFDLVRRVDTGDVDEVWIQAVPGFGMWETTMAGPNAYWCNSGPIGGVNGTHLFIVTAFNYEREPDVMIHDWGHRAESILGGKVYGGWDAAN